VPIDTSMCTPPVLSRAARSCTCCGHTSAFAIFRKGYVTRTSSPSSVTVPAWSNKYDEGRSRSLRARGHGERGDETRSRGGRLREKSKIRLWELSPLNGRLSALRDHRGVQYVEYDHLQQYNNAPRPLGLSVVQFFTHPPPKIGRRVSTGFPLFFGFRISDLDFDSSVVRVDSAAVRLRGSGHGRVHSHHWRSLCWKSSDLTNARGFSRAIQ
jgi:hypothetical protein